jgi:hypothetical protein
MGETYDDTGENAVECPACEGNGTLDEEGRVEDLGNMFEYGLAFDYVASETFGEDQEEGYFRYQLSWGGPSDEFRVFADKSGKWSWSVYRVTYNFMDWFDGAERRLFGEDRDLLEEIFSSFFVDCGTADHVYEQAVED